MCYPSCHGIGIYCLEKRKPCIVFADFTGLCKNVAVGDVFAKIIELIHFLYVVIHHFHYTCADSVACGLVGGVCIYLSEDIFLVGVDGVYAGVPLQGYFFGRFAEGYQPQYLGLCGCQVVASGGKEDFGGVVAEEACAVGGAEQSGGNLVFVVVFQHNANVGLGTYPLE